MTQDELYRKEFENIISFDNLYKGLKDSCRNVRWKSSVMSYEMNAIQNTYQLRQDLLNGKYKIQPYQIFQIHEPKERTIVATRIRDRQFQHSLVDNYLYDQLTKSFIGDNCACLRNRGVDDCLHRMTRHLRKLGIDLNEIPNLVDINVENLKEMYPELEGKRDTIKNVLIEEKNKFMRTLENGEKEFMKAVERVRKDGKNKIDGQTVFNLYETYGFPQEITVELAKENGVELELDKFDELYKAHQEKSRLGAEQKFKGGLAEQNEQTTAYHTATHLLHQALRTVLGDHVRQNGSNITTERLRFDFTHPQKVTPEELKKVEDMVNEQIKRDLRISPFYGLFCSSLYKLNSLSITNLLHRMRTT